MQAYLAVCLHMRTHSFDLVFVCECVRAGGRSRTWVPDTEILFYLSKHGVLLFMETGETGFHYQYSVPDSQNPSTQHDLSELLTSPRENRRQRVHAESGAHSRLCTAGGERQVAEVVTLLTALKQC